MFAISVCQPAATLMALGSLRWNERHWATALRGPILLHAAESLSVRSWALWAIPEVRTAFRTRSRVLELPSASRGQLIATIELVDCIPVERVHETTRYPTPLDGYCSPLKPGSSVLVFANPRPLPFPVYCRGGKGLFTPDQQALKHLEAT